MLYGRHLGFRGDFETRFAERDPKALELFESMEEVRKDAAEFMKIRAVWQFFEAESEGNTLHLFEPGAVAPLHIFNFKRQRAGDFLCLSDYVLTPQTENAIMLLFLWLPPVKASASAAKRQKTRATTSNRTGCKRSRSSPRKLARSGCIAASAKTGVPRSARTYDGAAFHFALSRKAVQLWLSRLPRPRRPGRPLEASEAGKKSACS